VRKRAGVEVAEPVVVRVDPWGVDVRHVGIMRLELPRSARRRTRPGSDPVDEEWWGWIVSRGDGRARGLIGPSHRRLRANAGMPDLSCGAWARCLG
jgi:hypothetical protein